MNVSYSQLLAITLPVFGIFGMGLVVRRAGWLNEQAEGSLIKLILYLFYPCLIFRNVLANPALRQAENVLAAPLVGAGTIALGMVVALYTGRLLGLTVGHGLRTFAFAAGIYNYGYIPIPLIQALWGRETVGVLLVLNVGCEIAIWSVGLLILGGLSLREGWRKLLNPITAALVVGIALNAAHVELPDPLLRAVDTLGACAIPLGLMLSGAMFNAFVDTPRELFQPRASLGGCLVRLALLPLLFLALAKWVPFSVELKRVIVVEAAMPAGMFALVISRHYGGQPKVAAQIILATSLLGLFLIPLLIKLGLYWVGV